MKNGLIWVVCFSVFFINAFAFAADPAAVEEITPPAAEGPLTIDQIPPIQSIVKGGTAMPTKPVPATAINALPADGVLPARPDLPPRITPPTTPQAPITTISTPAGRVSATPILPQMQPKPPSSITTTPPPPPLNQ